MPDFESRLTGGHPNSLGNTIEVVEDVLQDHGRFDALFSCYFSIDETVRLRTSNAMKRLCKEVPELLVPYLDRFLIEIANINQASTQWTLAHLFRLLSSYMSSVQKDLATAIMRHNLEYHNDWIVLNETMKTLSLWAQQDAQLRQWIIPQLERLAKDARKSVSKTAQKSLVSLK